MQGERFNPQLEPFGTRLRSIELSNSFGYDGDVHSLMALKSIMNAFPRAVAHNGRPLPIKCDVFRGKSVTDIAFATKRNDCYWILFADTFVSACANNAAVLASVVPQLEPTAFKGVRTDHLQSIVLELTMEIVVHHELCHIKQGHVDVAVSGGGLGLAESESKVGVREMFAHKFKSTAFRQRSMELVADEAGIGATLLESGKGNWVLVEPQAKQVFDTRTLALATYLGMLALVIELSPSEASEGYPSKPARMYHFHSKFQQYAVAGSSDSRLNFDINVPSLIDDAHLILDVINEAASRNLLGDRSRKVKEALSSMFSKDAHSRAQHECAQISSEYREDSLVWAPFRGEYVEWADYVDFERRHGRNPIGLPPKK